MSTRTRTRALLLAAALLVPALGGCSLSLDTHSLGAPVTFSPPADTAGTAHFAVTTHAVYGLWGIATFKQPSLQRALAAQLVGGRGVADLHVKVRSRWSDVLITVLTAGLVVPRSVTYEGVVTGSPPPAGQ